MVQAWNKHKALTLDSVSELVLLSNNSGIETGLTGPSFSIPLLFDFISSYFTYVTELLSLPKERSNSS